MQRWSEIQRVGVLSEVPAALVTLGCDARAVIRNAGLDYDVVADLDGQITYEQMGRLLHACVRATGCEYFGLLIGQRFMLAHLGLAGELMRQGPTLGDALQTLIDNQVRYVRGATFYLYIQDEAAVFGYSIYGHNVPGVDYIIDGAVAASVRALLELATLTPSDIMLARTAPTNPTVYAAYATALGNSIHFDVPQSAVMFPAAKLHQRVPNANPAIRNQLTLRLEKYWLAAQPSTSEVLTRLLQSKITLGPVTLPQISDQLKLHPRTLNRRLKNEGVSFQDLLARAKFTVARQLLLGTRMNIAEISHALGYADPAVFSRSFRRWAGTTPTQWRVNPPQD